MRKLKITILFLAVLSVQLLAQGGRHGKGYKAFQASYGYNRQSTMVTAGHIAYLKRNLSFDKFLSLESGSTKTQNLQIAFASAGLSYTVNAFPGKSVFISTGARGLLGGDYRESKVFEDKSHLKLCYGIMVNAQSEIYLGDIFSIVLSADHRVQITGTLKPQNISHLMAGLRYNF